MKFSHSQMQVWQRCQYRWYMEYIEGWKNLSPSRPLKLGSLVHEMFNFCYSHLRENPDADLAEFFMHAVLNEELPFPLDSEVFMEAVRLTTRYMQAYQKNADKDFTILGSELRGEANFKTPMGRNYVFIFIIDLLLQSQVTGKLWTMDHKTSGNGFWTPMELLADAQQPLYGKGLENVTGTAAFGFIVNQINTYPYKHFDTEPIEKIYRRDHAYRTDLELNNIIDNVGAHIDTIENKVEMIESIPPEILFPRSLSRECKLCPMQEPCILRLKGASTSGLIGSGFSCSSEQDSETLQPEPASSDSFLL